MRKARERTNLGGLDLESLPTFDEDESPPEDHVSLYEKFNQAAESLEKRGFKFNLNPPTEQLEDLPDDLTGMSPSTLFLHYQTTLRYWDFLASVMADLEARLITLKNQLDRVEAELKKEGKASHEVVLDKRYQPWNEEIVKLKAQLVLLGPQKSSLHRRMVMLSRSVEGARLDASLGGRGENLNRPRRGTPGGYGTDL